MAYTYNRREKNPIFKACASHHQYAIRRNTKQMKKI